MKKAVFYIPFAFLLVLSACQSKPAPQVASVSEEKTTESTTAEEAPANTPAPSATAMPTTAPDFDPQPAEGQRMTFQTEDGVELVGYYYPAAVANAPLIVLMHWARGDQNDWIKNGMVDWLQNRNTSHGTNKPALQSTLYPPLPADQSFAVFTFDFRGFGESNGEFSPAGGLMDAKAAYGFARTLEGVDPTRVAGIGSSIGADGVVDGCTSGCVGALSLSPGGYLGIVYTEAVTALDELEKPVTCVAAEGDITSAVACQAATGQFYENILYVGGQHGDQLYQNPPEGFGQMLYDWLVKVYKIE